MFQYRIVKLCKPTLYKTILTHKKTSKTFFRGNCWTPALYQNHREKKKDFQ